MFASSSMPSLDRCDVVLDRRGLVGGLGLFDTAKGRELLERGIVDAASYLVAVPEGAFVVVPGSRYISIGGAFRMIGASAEGAEG